LFDALPRVIADFVTPYFLNGTRMKLRLLLIAAVASFMFLAGCKIGMPQASIALSDTELQAIQSKEFDSTPKIAFDSVMSVFLDLGYKVTSSNYDTGNITAQKRIIFQLLLSGAKREIDEKVTASIERIDTGKTSVRLNFVSIGRTSTASDIWRENEEPIRDEKIYKNAFARIERSIYSQK
jgi:PBP1b-binding outer membrane lipoprotein LpoB